MYLKLPVRSDAPGLSSTWARKLAPRLMGERVRVGRMGGRVGGKERGREGKRKGEREGGREGGGREGGREAGILSLTLYTL